MYRKITLLGLLIGAFVSAKADFTRISIASGYNNDVIANGTGTAANTTTIPFEDAGGVLMVLGYNNGTNISPIGLPVNGIINSMHTAGLSYQLADYSANNDMQISTAGTTTGTLVFSSPISADEVYLLATAGSGNTIGTITVNFTSGTPMTFSNTTFPDWNSVLNNAYVYLGMGNAVRTFNTLNLATNNPRLFDIKLDLGIANAGRQVASVTVSTSSGTGRINVLAVTTNSICTGTPAGGTTVMTPGAVCNNATFSLSTTGTTIAGGLVYQWQSSPEAANNWSDLPGANSLTDTITGGLAVNTDYRLKITCTASSQIAYATPYTVKPLTSFGNGTFTIDNTQPTGGANFASFNDAVNVIKCGITGPVVFNVKNATYNENIVIPVIPGASATNTITFNGNGATISYSAVLSNLPATIELNGADYININNLTVIATGAANAACIHLWNQADNNKFDNCTLTCLANTISSNTASFSIGFSQTNLLSSGALTGMNNVVSNCTMSNGTYGAVFAGNTAAGLGMMGNKLINCHITDFYNYGVYLTGQNGMVVSNNNIERPARTVLSTFYGIFMSASCVSSLIEKNRIHSPYTTNPAGALSAAYGVNSASVGGVGTENLFSNNAIYDMTGSGTMGGLYMAGATYYKLYHNTVSLDYAGATAGTTNAIYSNGTTGTEDIRNNIITVGRGGTGTKNCLFYAGGLQVSNNNDIYMTSTTGTNSLGSYAGTLYTSLATWQTAATNLDATSRSLDPQYTSAGTGDLTPTNTLLNNLGVPVGIATDILGNPRSPSFPDMGAYEFGAFPLAIKLVNISAVNVGTMNRVDWSTASELASDKFEIEKSIDGNSFNYLGSLNAKSETATYNYWDKMPAPGENYYRLKMIDASGNVDYSKVVMANVATGVFAVAVYPNPVNDVLTIKVNGTITNNASVILSDITGKVLKSISITNDNTTINMTDMPQGLYLVKYTDDSHTQTIKISK